jgi:hypothetical protein
MRLAAILAGAVLAAGFLAADPARYFSLADRVAWRLGTPAPGQTQLEASCTRSTGAAMR